MSTNYLSKILKINDLIKSKRRMKDEVVIKQTKQKRIVILRTFTAMMS